VFDTILDSATHLCGAARGGLFLFDGDSFRAASMRGATPASLEYHTGRAIRPGPLSALGRIIHERRPVHLHDLMDDPAYREGDPLRRAVVDLEGMRTLVMVPLLQGERLVGAIGVHRREVRPFGDAQIALLQASAAVEAPGGATVALRPHLRRVQHGRFTGDTRQSHGALPSS
jgi:GAF domain-containing protein